MAREIPNSAVTRNIGVALAQKNQRPYGSTERRRSRVGANCVLPLRRVPNALGLGSLDQRVRIVRQQKALRHEIIGRFLERRGSPVAIRSAFVAAKGIKLPCKLHMPFSKRSLRPRFQPVYVPIGACKNTERMPARSLPSASTCISSTP